MSKKTAIQPPAKSSNFNWAWLFLPLILIGAYALYAPTLEQRITSLDDSIFIEDNYPFNQDMGNLGHSFSRGVFSEDKDEYYRPLLLWSFILDCQAHGLVFEGYKTTNLLLHLVAVGLAFFFFRKLSFSTDASVFLTAMFAVLPALCQAVAWVPGRNDSLLGIFALAMFLMAAKYAETRKIGWLIGQFFMLLACLFTKETGIMAAPAVGLMLVGWASPGLLKEKQKALFLAASWVLALGIWYAAREMATLARDNVSIGSTLPMFFQRIPLIWQYFGKVLLPVNLSVFPMMEDTSPLPGLLAIVGFAALALLTPEKPWRKYAAGLGWFTLFLLPAFILPKGLNEQVFEHRLYLPSLGVLAALGCTILVNNKLQNNIRYAIWAALVAVFAFLNVQHQPVFEDEFTFWKNAVDNSPSSSYAHMLYAVRNYQSIKMDKDAQVKAAKLKLVHEQVEAAYRLNPEEKYVNHYKGMFALEEKKYPEAQQFFEKEVANTGLADSYYFLSRSRFEQGNKAGAIECLEKFIEKIPTELNAYNNLFLMYQEAGDTAKIEGLRNTMKKNGLKSDW